MTKKKKKIGRRSRLDEWTTPDKLTILEGWARDGLTDKQIADNIGIVESTIYSWKNRSKEFDEALKKGKEVVDRHVENALLKRALGYSTEEVKIERVFDEASGEFTEIVTERKVKEVAPDTTAQIFWLKNRKPYEWRDRKNIDLSHKGEMQVSDPFKDLTTDELRALVKKGEKEK